MRARSLSLIAVLALAFSSSTAVAMKDDGRTTKTEVDSGGNIDVEANNEHHPSVVYTTGGGSGPRCLWNLYSQREWAIANGIAERQPPAYDDDPDVEIAPEEIARRETERVAWQREEDRRLAEPVTAVLDGVLHQVFSVRCPGQGGELRLVPPGIDSDDLLPGIFDAARGQIVLPTPDVSPRFEFTGYVNLGMWLAVEPTSMQPITAEAGPNAWVTVTPQHDSIVFDFGNGDTVTCDGFGVPIVDLETFDEGPCGYTYGVSSPDDDPYVVTVGTTWNLAYESSDGAGALPPFTREATFEHNVDELQTIGRSN